MLLLQEILYLIKINSIQNISNNKGLFITEIWHFIIAFDKNKLFNIGDFINLNNINYINNIILNNLQNKRKIDQLLIKNLNLLEILNQD